MDQLSPLAATTSFSGLDGIFTQHQTGKQRLGF
jgi:hypothetical protein